MISQDQPQPFRLKSLEDVLPKRVLHLLHRGFCEDQNVGVDVLLCKPNGKDVFLQSIDFPRLHSPFCRHVRMDPFGCKSCIASELSSIKRFKELLSQDPEKPYYISECHLGLTRIIYPLRVYDQYVAFLLVRSMRMAGNEGLTLRLIDNIIRTRDNPKQNAPSSLHVLPILLSKVRKVSRKELESLAQEAYVLSKALEKMIGEIVEDNEELAREELMSRVALEMRELESKGIGRFGSAFANQLGPMILSFCNVKWFAIYRIDGKRNTLSRFAFCGIQHRDLPETLSTMNLQPSRWIETETRGSFAEIGDLQWAEMFQHPSKYSRLKATRFAYWKGGDMLDTLFLYGPGQNSDASLLETVGSKQKLLSRISGEILEQIDVSMSHINLETSLYEKNSLIERYTVLHDEFGKMSKVPSEAQLLNNIVTGLDRLGFSRVRVYLYTPITKTLHSAVSSGLPPEESQHFQNGGYSFDRTNAVTWKAIDTHSLVFCCNPSHPEVVKRLGHQPTKGSSHQIGRLLVHFGEPDFFGFHVGEEWPAWIDLPLLVGKECLGKISITPQDGEMFDDDEVVLLESFASMAATSLERVRLRHVEYSEIISLAGHEIVAPLQTISASSEFLDIVLQKCPSCARKVRYAVSDIAFAARLVSFLNDGFIFLTIDRPIHSAIPKKFHSDVLAPIVALIRHYVRRQNINANIDYADFAPWSSFYVDERFLQQIVYNLVSNSIKYGKQYEQVNIRIRDGGSDPTYSRYQPDYYIAIFEDDGIGIDPNLAFDDMTQMGTRGDNAKKADVQGLGRGLYICNKILSNVGGFFTLDNRKDPTRFTICLPRFLTHRNWQDNQGSHSV